MMDPGAVQPVGAMPSAERTWWLGGLALVLAGVAYAPTCHEIFTDWVFTPADFNYYSHGPLVLVVAAIFAYARGRGQSLPIVRGGVVGALGLLVLAGSLLFHVVCTYAEVRFASGFTIVTALAGWVLWMWGWTGFRRFWFPILVLVFAVPLPEVAVATISAELKFFAADQAVALTNGLGVPAVQPSGQGSFVYLQGGKEVVVGDVCSGLRSLISLLFFGTVYVYICKARGWRRVLLFLAVFPIAILSNIVRIAATLIVTDKTTVEFGTGPFHEWMGLGLFIVAFMLLFGLERLLLSLQRDAGAPPIAGERKGAS